MKNLTWQNPEQLFVAQVLIKKVKLKCCGIKDDENYITNIVSSNDCMILAEFLKGNNAYKGSHDETIWINRERAIIERLIGIKIEK